MFIYLQWKNHSAIFSNWQNFETCIAWMCYSLDLLLEPFINCSRWRRTDACVQGKVIFVSTCYSAKQDGMEWNIDFTYGCSPSTCKTGNTFEKKLIIRRLTSFKCSSIFYLLAFDWFMTVRNYAHQWRCWFQSGRLCVPPLIVKKVQMQMMVNGFKA